MNIRTSLLLMVVVAGPPCLRAQRLDVEEVEDFGEQLPLPCSHGYIPLANSCYKFHLEKKTWEAARTSCKSENADLGSVDTEEQYTQILQHLKANYNGKYWTSGKVIASRWIWTAYGTPMNRKWWGRYPGSSPNQCAYFCSYTDRYWGVPCSGRYPYICEKTLDIDIRRGGL